MRILIVKPSSLGDVVHALPVLRLLRLAHPDARIDWWLSPGLFPLLAGDPDLDDLVPFHKRGPWQWLQALRRVRATRYDLVVDLQGLARSGAMSWLADGSRSIGLDLNREGARGFYDETVSRPSPDAHAVDWYLAVAQRLGLDTRREFAWLPVGKTTDNPPVEPHIALVPGARWQNKRWPTAHFRSLTEQLLSRQADLKFAIYGDGGDRALAADIASAHPGQVIDRTGTTPLPELVEHLRNATAVVTNDTGPMHIAAALGRPVVALFGPTDPRLTGPYGAKSAILRFNLPCAPCLKSRCRWQPRGQCLTDLTPETVVEAVWQHVRQ
jgi:heptosyltransferase-1